MRGLNLVIAPQLLRNDDIDGRKQRKYKRSIDSNKASRKLLKIRSMFSSRRLVEVKNKIKKWLVTFLL